MGIKTQFVTKAVLNINIDEGRLRSNRWRNVIRKSLVPKFHVSKNEYEAVII